MTKTVAYHWHLRKVMTDNDIHSTTKLVPLLADRGVVMTSTQVYRIVTGEPERLNMQLLAALCDIFDCTPNDLIEPYVVTASTRGRKAASGDAKTPAKSGGRGRPTRAVIKTAND
ncbi:MAG: helix-turn-helix transcriptional regulator [Nocardioides sp.]|uniref:helix-turn-helix domain-containing protein n=1 Tax=Nocardioides sp. TaxID=35761 RepID=UPI0039E5D46D